MPSPGPRWIVAATAGGLSLSLIVALAAFRRPVWTPVLDLAMTELRVRDVGGGHTPLIGLPGRIGPPGEQGSHPGPLSFYALAPVYRLLGSTSWALQAATVAVHALALASAAWLARRRGGVLLVAGLACALAFLMAGYGAGTLTEPWNPYLPLLWWVVVLLAAWSVLTGDVVALPVLVAAGSFCAQTHVPYLALSLGLGALAVAGTVLHVRRQPEDRRRTRRWALVALVVGVVLWAPPSLDQLDNDPGNYRLLIDHFTDPPEEPVGFATGARVALEHLDVAHLARSALQGPGWLVRDPEGHRASAATGAVVLAAWAAAAGLSIRQGTRALRSLHVVVGAALVLMVLSVSRIFGTLWYYLSLWGWSIGALALLASAWTFGAAVSGSWDAEQRARRGARATMALAGVAALVVLRFAVAAPDAPHGDAPVAAELAAVIDDVADGLDRGEGAATGDAGTYLVTWTDAIHIGSQGYGLLSELERRGFDVGVERSHEVPATDHRVLVPGEETARVHLATGSYIDRVRALDGAVELGYVDPRTGDELEEQDALREAARADMEAAGLDDLVPFLVDNLFALSLEPSLPAVTRDRVERMLEIGSPLAVFVVSPAGGGL